MIERTNIYDNYSDLAEHAGLFSEYGSINDILFFDIETTGLSATTSVIYLIGCLYADGNRLYLTQYLSEGKDDENEVLSRFLKLAANYRTLVHFNGQTFDIPFIQKRAAHLEIKESLNSMGSFDLYKKLRKYKDFFGLDNAKQVSFEKAARYERKDTFNGGELISVFGKFVGINRLVSLRPDDESVLSLRDEMRETLLCHNHDDVFGMVRILKLFDRLPELSCPGGTKAPTTKPEKLQIKASDNLRTIKLEPKLTTPHIDVREISGVSLAGKSLKVSCSIPMGETIMIPVIHTQLKLFFPNYKDYIYLPVEDRVIPKSMGSFIDKSAKEKAVKENCYTRHIADFIPLYTELLECPTHVFRQSYDSKDYFIEVNEFMNSGDDYILKYVQSFIKKTTIE